VADIAPDGEHFVKASRTGVAQGELVLVVNWFTELLEWAGSNCRAGSINFGNRL